MKKELTRRHVVVTNMPYLLLKTLIKRKCLSNFIDNYLSQSGDDNLHIVKYMKCEDVIAILMRSFLWEETPEGHFFWQDLYKELYKAAVIEDRKYYQYYRML